MWEVTTQRSGRLGDGKRPKYLTCRQPSRQEATGKKNGGENLKIKFKRRPSNFDRINVRSDCSFRYLGRNRAKFLSLSLRCRLNEKSVCVTCLLSVRQSTSQRTSFTSEETEPPRRKVNSSRLLLIKWQLLALKRQQTVGNSRQIPRKNLRRFTQHPDGVVNDPTKNR